MSESAPVVRAPDARCSRRARAWLALVGGIASLVLPVALLPRAKGTDRSYRVLVIGDLAFGPLVFYLVFGLVAVILLRQAARGFWGLGCWLRRIVVAMGVVVGVVSAPFVAFVALLVVISDTGELRAVRDDAGHAVLLYQEDVWLSSKCEPVTVYTQRSLLTWTYSAMLAMEGICKTKECSLTHEYDDVVTATCHGRERTFSVTIDTSR